MIESKSCGGIILNPENKVLVVSQEGRTWSLPKGHCEPNETALETAIREIHEETGLSNCKFIHYLGHYTRYKIGLDGHDDLSEKKNIHLFLFKTNEIQLNPKDPDNPEARWVPIQETANLLTHDKDKAFFTKHIPLLESLTHSLIQIETTFPSQESANACMRPLITENKAACCHFTPITSTYIWENKQEHSQEIKCTLKTIAQNYSSIETHIKKNHPYDCPEITSHQLSHANPDYATWVSNQSNSK